MGIFNKERTDGATYDGQGDERKGIIDRIKYNGEADELVWKFPYDNISTKAQLIVNQSQEAIFFSGGAAADVFGPGTHTLSANNLPILQRLINLPFGGNTPFTAEVWYINKTVKRDLRFGTTEPVPLLDPLYDVMVPVRARGSYGIQLIDSSIFLQELVGTEHLTTTEDVIKKFRGEVTQKTIDVIGKFLVREEIPIIKINAYLNDVAKKAREGISEEFERYGIRITNFNIESLNFDQNDENVKKMLDSHAERGRLKALSEQADMYKMERQLDVMQTAAGNEGSAGTMMGAGMGLGMGFGIGGAFGQQMGNMAGVMQQQPQYQQQPPYQQPQTAPPPPPQQPAYYAMVNGAQQGPFAVAQLAQLVQSGQATRGTLVWTAGMAGWEPAGNRPDLGYLFGAVPPPPPPPMPMPPMPPAP